MGFFGPRGCGGESIAARVHVASAPRELMVRVEGPLMDAELLEASMTPLIHLLSDSKEATATALVTGLDEMSAEAQHRLAELIDTYAPRLRLLALASQKPRELGEPLEEPSADPDPLSILSDEQYDSAGILERLVDLISALTVTIDPLASRVDDIPIMATAMLDECRSAGDVPADRFSRAALDALVLYPWPGNVDELKETIVFATNKARQSSIAAEDLPLAVRSYRPGSIPGKPLKGGTASDDRSLDEAVRRYELRLIREALENANDNRSEAARRLGISRARLIRRLEEAATSDDPETKAQS